MSKVVEQNAVMKARLGALVSTVDSLINGDTLIGCDWEGATHLFLCSIFDSIEEHKEDENYKFQIKHRKLDIRRLKNGTWKLSGYCV